MKGTKTMNKTMKYTLLTALTLTIMLTSSEPSWAQGDASQTKHYLYTNDRKTTNTTSVFKVRSTATPPLPLALETGGNGSGDNFFGAAKMVIAADVGTEGCFYVANADSNNITAFTVTGNKYVGIFSGSTNEVYLGGMASNGSYLYAAFSGINDDNRTIGTFQMSAGCGLTYIGEKYVNGLASQPVNGMAAHGDLLVVTYQDGSIQSFTNTAGVLASNGDEQYTAGKDHSPVLSPKGVDISQNGQYAIFGDDGSTTAVEVSDISSGKLTPTVLYDDLGAGLNATNIMLSPNDDLLYVANGGSATVTGLRFNQKTGTVSYSCISSTLKGTSVSAQGLALYSTTGTGSVLYVAEYDSSTNASSVGMLTIKDTGGKCTLTENATNTNSPFSAPNSYQLLSISVYPPRPF
jgi:6-phosphogluconolactonase (cycloisomerase 2 family)